jgi:hypothetical protein
MAWRERFESPSNPAISVDDHEWIHGSRIHMRQLVWTVLRDGKCQIE